MLANRIRMGTGGDEDLIILTEGHPDNYRYIMWIITENKGADIVQVSVFDLYANGVLFNYPADTTISNPNGRNPSGEQVENLLIRNTGNKWLDFEFGNVGSSTVKIDLQDAYGISAYRWATANDATERDPISWTILGSANNRVWYLLDERSGESITDTRQSYTAMFSFPHLAPSTVKVGLNSDVWELVSAIYVSELSYPNNNSIDLKLNAANQFGTNNMLITKNKIQRGDKTTLKVQWENVGTPENYNYSYFQLKSAYDTNIDNHIANVVKTNTFSRTTTDINISSLPNEFYIAVCCRLINPGTPYQGKSSHIKIHDIELV